MGLFSRNKRTGDTPKTEPDKTGASVTEREEYVGPTLEELGVILTDETAVVGSSSGGELLFHIQEPFAGYCRDEESGRWFIWNELRMKKGTDRVEWSSGGMTDHLRLFSTHEEAKAWVDAMWEILNLPYAVALPAVAVASTAELQEIAMAARQERATIAAIRRNAEKAVMEHSRAVLSGSEWFKADGDGDPNC